MSTEAVQITPEASTEEVAPASGEVSSPAAAVEETEVPLGTTDGETETSAATADDEKKKDEKPEDKPAGWKAVEIAKKEQLRIARQRGEISVREEKIAQREQHHESQVQRMNAWATEVQRREHEVVAFQRAISEGDIETLERKYGLSYEKLTRNALEARDPAARLERVERAAQEREQREQQHHVQQAQVAQTRHDAQQLVTITEEYATEFPNLYGWKPERIAYEGIAVRDALMRQGHRPTYDYVLSILERTAKTERDHDSQRRTALEQRKSGQPRDAGSAGNAAMKGNSGSPATTPALTAKTAVVKATPPREKTEAEIDEECLAELRKLKR